MTADETADLFASAWHKWMRGFQHAFTLQNFIATAHSAPDSESWITLVNEPFDPERQVLVTRIAEVKPLPPHWAIFLGDALFNYRSALDHLAWALVSRGRTPPEALSERQQRSIYFPTSTTKDQFARDALSKLPGARKADVKIVKKYQPFHAADVDSHWLMRLRTLNDHDKHRAIRTLYAFPSGGNINVKVQRDCEVISDGVVGATKAEVGTELVSIPVKVTGPNAYIDLDRHFNFEIGLDDQCTLKDLLEKCGAHSKRLLEEFSERPSDEEISAFLRWKMPREAQSDS